jgi:hypothetical protein
MVQENKNKDRIRGLDFVRISHIRQTSLQRRKVMYGKRGRWPSTYKQEIIYASAVRNGSGLTGATCAGCLQTKVKLER